jgi:hypothetical protein
MGVVEALSRVTVKVALPSAAVPSAMETTGRGGGRGAAGSTFALNLVSQPQRRNTGLSDCSPCHSVVSTPESIRESLKVVIAWPPVGGLEGMLQTSPAAS